MSENSTTIHYQDLFPTRIWFLALPIHMSQSESWIQTINLIQSNDPEGVKKSNRGGWQSNDTLFKDDMFTLLSDALKKIFIFCLDEMSPGKKPKFAIHAWANINSPGGYNLPHTHAPALLSAVYYLRVPENSGAIYFKDPRLGALLSGFRGSKNNCPPNCSADAKVVPYDGLVLVFPPWLEHGVEEHVGEGPRISIAANAILAE